ncbi:MAG: pyruvate:ferredoxin (flavodoxin) oxidoreductase [Lachnospiraceae bacterium]|nr:pyruvate:ferredoxin (flavodoxin) oxidoreductase [Lachnospiraceae bacterium]
MKRIQKTMDGNQAAAHVAYAYTEVAAIYPITPSSTMAEYTDEWSREGLKNIFGHPVQVSQMQSEAGAAGALHGSLITGALSTTFTASQGLLLMIPNLYRVAGELLPSVFHVAARTIATHALSIFGDHSDIYACRQTGVAMLATGSVQEVMDLAPVAHLAAIKGRVPFLHFFDGFRTSHEQQKIDVWDYETLENLLDKEALHAFREHSLHPSHMKMMGSAQNPDIFFQNREACNTYYDNLPAIVENYMMQINERIGTTYGLFNYSGAPDATHVIIAMGSVCETIEETVNYVNQSGEKNGVVKVHLYRPFSAAHLINCLPSTVQQITVLDRTKEPGAMGEPLYLDVVAALKNSSFANVPVYSGRYGLSSKDTTPDQILAVLNNVEKPRFTIGIKDDVTHLSLDIHEHIDPLPADIYNCKFWGLGGDGTISANKNSIKIIGNHTDKYVQAYYDYDSKKSRGLTISHLRFGDSPIHAPYLVQKADFVACHNPVYLHKYNMVQDVKDGGTFLLNCYWQEKDLEEALPPQVKRYLAEHHIRLYIIDAIRIGKEIGLNNKVSTILQAAFFSVTGILPMEDASALMKEAAENSYRKKGEKIVEMNFAAIDRGLRDVLEVQIPSSWAKITEEEPLDVKTLPDHAEITDYVDNLQKKITRQEGNDLPVSAFLPYVDGAFPPGTTAHERRNVATEVPRWLPENCIQCNRCSYVCPHAVIRPAVLTKEEAENAPKGMQLLPFTGMPDYFFGITVSKADCTGCGSCAGVCPGKQGNKALEMCPIHEMEEHQEYFDYGKALPMKPELLEKFKKNTVKGSQFCQPLLEFHGACAGCGETPYAILVTQLFGERMYIGNATGCSSIWANSSPSTAYTVNKGGCGPAWSNSLFEDGAEFGYGMLLAQKALRGRLKELVEQLIQGITGQKDYTELADACGEWLDTFEDGDLNTGAAKRLVGIIRELLQKGEKGNPKGSTSKPLGALQAFLPTLTELLIYKDYLAKKSHWVFGGDGFAYDIGFGGLDHVLSSGENINILIFDTEVYSNTGGQASKATPTGSTAKFASGGKTTRKKDLAAMAMTYQDVYVAQIAMGADYNQTLKALWEAEHYPGPSLIIAYSPCINHGVKAGMGSSQHEEAKAVETGYWHLFRYNPSLREAGQNPFQLDSKAPTLDYDEFLAGETRYTALELMRPEDARELFAKAEEDAKKRYAHLCKLKRFYEPDNNMDI